MFFVYIWCSDPERSVHSRSISTSEGGRVEVAEDGDAQGGGGRRPRVESTFRYCDSCLYECSLSLLNCLRLEEFKIWEESCQLMEDLDEVYKGQRISKEVIVHTQSKENIIFDFDHSMIYFDIM